VPSLAGLALVGLLTQRLRAGLIKFRPFGTAVDIAGAKTIRQRRFAIDDPPTRDHPRGTANDVQPTTHDQRPTTNDGFSHPLQPLHIMHTGDFAHSVDYVFEVLEVFDFHDDVDVGLAVFGAGAYAADVGFEVADYGGDLL
jgi:hypothetical protein